MLGCGCVSAGPDGAWPQRRRDARLARLAAALTLVAALMRWRGWRGWWLARLGAGLTGTRGQDLKAYYGWLSEEERWAADDADAASDEEVPRPAAAAAALVRPGPVWGCVCG